MSEISVLHVTFNMGFGGTEQVILQLISNSPSSIRHEVLCIDGAVGPIGDILKDKGVEVNALSRGEGFDFGLIKKLKNRIDLGGFDIVHCHQYTPFVYGYFASAFSKRRARVVFTEHGRFYPDRYRFKAIIFNIVMSLTSSAVVAISEATKKSLSRYEFMPAFKINVIYNGILPLRVSDEQVLSKYDELGIPEDSVVLGTVSRLDPVKNQSLMIKSFKSLVDKGINCRLLIVGDGPERTKLQNLVNKLDLNDYVIFTGFIKHPQSYLAAMDVFLLPSHTEGTSMTLLESMSLSIPAVVTRVGGNPEIVKHEETGLVVEPGNEVDFSKAISRLVDNKSLRLEMGLNARRVFLERFTVEKMVANYEKLYKRVLAN